LRAIFDYFNENHHTSDSFHFPVDTSTTTSDNLLELEAE